MNNIKKSLILLPAFALLLAGCTPSEDVPEVKEDDTTSECEGDECTLTEGGNEGGNENEYNYDSAYALVGDFTDSSWNEKPSESSKYYLAYDSTKKESMYWELTATMSNTSGYAPSFYVTEYGVWNLVAGFTSLNPYSLGVDLDYGTNDGGIQCSSGGTYNITIDMTGNDAYILVEQQFNYDDYYVLVGYFDDDSWSLTPTNQDYYLWFDSSDSSSMYWKVTINISGEPTDDPNWGTYTWNPGFRVVEHTTGSNGSWITVADFDNLSKASTGALSSAGDDNNILVSEWGYTYDLEIDFRDTNNKSILVTQATVTSDDAILNDDGTYKELDTDDSYIVGMDVSSIVEVLKAGGKFYDYDGKELTDIDAYMEFLAENGVNYARIRLWNDPTDTSGNSYEGGGNDLETDLEIAKAAVKAGMKICLDLHYSDFWAHHGQQFAPKAWTSYNASTKATTAANWTSEVLGKFKDAGCTPSMVQVGNETNNNQICGLTSSSDEQNFFKSCCSAVRNFATSNSTDIKIVVHYAMDQYAANYISNFNSLISAGVDFDVLGLSYYPYWHTNETLQYVLAQLKSKIPSKEICIMEYSYGWTDEWSYVASSRSLDNQSGGVMQNTFWTTEADIGGYAASVDGQTQCVYDINKAVVDAGGLGAFYWEPGWLAVDGSSWASSYAASYYSSNGVTNSGYNTCTWANQAFFNYSGKALNSLKVYSQILGE